jgi:hypothetical protein
MYCLITKDSVMKFDSMNELTDYVYKCDSLMKKKKQTATHTKKKLDTTQLYTIVPGDHKPVVVTFD